MIGPVSASNRADFPREFDIEPVAELASLRLRRGLQPDRWELDGLRRRSALADLLEVGELPE